MAKKNIQTKKKSLPKAQNGIEGTMGGLTDIGFNYNGAWGGTMQDGGYIDSVLNANKNLDWVQRLYEKNTPSIKIPGQKGRSTHFMESADGRVYPTVVRMPNGKLKYLADKAYDYADSTKTYIQFPSDEAAQQFGKNYKKGTGVLKDFAMGGSMPGAVGFTYARTQGAAPSNGPYAKKTKASAQNGEEITPTQFYNEYLNSPNYINRLKLQGYKDPKKTIKDRLNNLNKTKVTNVKGIGNVYHPDQNTINLDSEEQKKYNLNPLSTKVHEYSHAAGSLGHYLTYPEKINNTTLNRKEINLIDRGNRFWNLNLDDRKKYSIDKAMEIQHDRLASEVKADIDVLRYNLKKDKIYDTGTQNFNQEYLNKSKNKYKNNKVINRLFDRYGDKDLINLMNTVAKTDDDDNLSFAQNGKEMKFYQEGLDFKPKTISKKGSKIIKDPRGQWAHPGEITKIPSNEITMQGVNYPVLGISDTGDTKMMYPNQDYVYEGNSVTEYPMMETGGSIQDKGQLKKLDQLTNFTNYNDMAKAKKGVKLKKAQMGMNALTGIGSSVLGGKGNFNNQQANQIGNILGGIGSLATGGSGNFGGMSGNSLGSQALDLFGGSGTAQKIMNVGPAGALGKGGAGFAKGLGAAGLGLVDSAGDIMKGFGQMKEQKQNIKKADQYAQVTGLTAQAAESRPEKVRRKYVRPEDTIIQPEQMAPNYGTGSNFLAAEYGAQIGGTPTEIQNMYNPGDLYEDLGYEPLNDTNVKQFRHGGNIPTAEFGDYFQSSGQASIGKGVGSAIGTAFFGPVGGMVGGLLGGVAGNVFGGAQDAEKLKGFQNQAEQNTQRAAYQQAGQSIQNQYSSFMEDGGYVSNNWTPQVIAKFGEYDVEDLFAPDRTMNTLRSGGHITQNYTFPQDQFQMGGELQTHWGGYAEPISQNPYLPGTGETVMFRGQSHDETNGKGQSGIGVTYGDNPVEVERGEPAVKMQDGGEESMVVYGNMKIPKYGVEELQDLNAKGKKFKNYVNDLSKTEAKQNKIIDKSSKKVNNLDLYTPFDNLEMNALQANLIGADMKLKNIAQRKQTAAQIQSAILDTAEEYGLESDALARGQIKKAKFGAKMSTAQDGTEEFSIKANLPGYIDYNAMPVSGSELWTRENYKSGWVPKVKEAFDNPTKARQLITRLENYSGQDAADVREALKKGKTFEEKKKIAMKLATDKKVGPYHKIMNDLIDIKRTPAETIIDRQKPTLGGFEPKGGPIDFKKAIPEERQKNKFNWRGLAESAISNLNPLFRPTDQEPLDPSQLMGEQFALATNQLEPVQAQSYKPLLEQPFDISLQDQLNANQADFNSIQRIAGNNPAALSALAAQKYGANSGVLGNQFRMNQAERAGVYNRNRGTLNDAQLKNLSLYDQQYVRQAQAKANTKDVAQAALNSISDKMAKNKLENKTLGVYENLYNYRFGPKGQAINFNDPAQFNMQGSPFGRSGADQIPEGYEYETVMKKKKTEKSRNGSIVKAIKNL